MLLETFGIIAALGLTTCMKTGSRHAFSQRGITPRPAPPKKRSNPLHSTLVKPQQNPAGREAAHCHGGLASEVGYPRSKVKPVQTGCPLPIRRFQVSSSPLPVVRWGVCETKAPELESVCTRDFWPIRATRRNTSNQSMDQSNRSIPSERQVDQEGYWNKMTKYTLKANKLQGVFDNLYDEALSRAPC